MRNWWASTYVINQLIYLSRWRKYTCLFTGIAGGGMYTHSGAAAEYVCLPHDPNIITNGVIQNKHGGISYIYGAEYEDNFFGKKIYKTTMHHVQSATLHQDQLF